MSMRLLYLIFVRVWGGLVFVGSNGSIARR